MNYLILFVLLFASITLKADVGSFDIIELSNGKHKLYAKIFSTGILKDQDLKYYNYKGEYINDVSSVFHKSISELDSIYLYSDLVRLNLKELDTQFEIDTILFAIQDRNKYDKQEILTQYEMVDAYNGNTAGITYTDGLTDNDAIWICDYEIETLFEFNDYELCGMKLYGIKNNITPSEIDSLKSEIDKLLKRNLYDEFDEKLRQLRKRHIIMVGFCSC